MQSDINSNNPVGRSGDLSALAGLRFLLGRPSFGSTR